MFSTCNSLSVTLCSVRYICSNADVGWLDSINPWSSESCFYQFSLNQLLLVLLKLSKIESEREKQKSLISHMREYYARF